jgi:serine/threonine-protein kinase RsbW
MVFNQVHQVRDRCTGLGLGALVPCTNRYPARPFEAMPNRAAIFQPVRYHRLVPMPSFSYEVRNRRDALSDLTRELDSTVLPVLVDPSERSALLLIVDELVSNLLKYGFEPGKDQCLNMHISLNDDWLQIDLKDNGRRFNPLARLSPESLNREVADRQTGGLGVYIVREMMDTAHYEWTPPWNNLTLRKKRRAKDDCTN